MVNYNKASNAQLHGIGKPRGLIHSLAMASPTVFLESFYNCNYTFLCFEFRPELEPNLRLRYGKNSTFDVFSDAPAFLDVALYD